MFTIIVTFIFIIVITTSVIVYGINTLPSPGPQGFSLTGATGMPGNPGFGPTGSSQIIGTIFTGPRGLTGDKGSQGPDGVTGSSDLFYVTTQFIMDLQAGAVSFATSNSRWARIGKHLAIMNGYFAWNNVGALVGNLTITLPIPFPLALPLQATIGGYGGFSLPAMEWLVLDVNGSIATLTTGTAVTGSNINPTGTGYFAFSIQYYVN